MQPVKPDVTAQVSVSFFFFTAGLPHQNHHAWKKLPMSNCTEAGSFTLGLNKDHFKEMHLFIGGLQH